jgi:hypothetical protein
MPDQDVTVVVGQISVTLRKPPALALLRCGHRHAAQTAGPAAGQRFFDELTKIREALLAACEVLAQPGDVHRPASPEEIHLARMLIELEVTLP